jgi:antitoxin ParD1/3/4
MATMNISLPDEMKSWIEGQAEGGRYANVSDFMRDIVRKERERLEYITWLNAEIEKGYESGFSEVDLDELFKEITGEQQMEQMPPA